MQVNQTIVEVFYFHRSLSDSLTYILLAQRQIFHYTKSMSHTHYKEPI